ncbi:hypothetical protein [Lentilitoribacter sp. Alg239-R112]|uniref:hypothetical protein n=1 Tax=Lentilitoribacter sp. Alg239-R112 TaxID=2305987 RepID=UPI0013A6F41B|nr:hypothetical protein [Lentilitoribacter sp. Alg239-R112]
MQAKTDVWMYAVSGKKLFLQGEEIPKGYVDSPAKVKKTELVKKAGQNANK